MIFVTENSHLPPFFHTYAEHLRGFYIMRTLADKFRTEMPTSKITPEESHAFYDNLEERVRVESQVCTENGDIDRKRRDKMYTDYFSAEEAKATANGSQIPHSASRDVNTAHDCTQIKSNFSESYVTKQEMFRLQEEQRERCRKELRQARQDELEMIGSGESQEERGEKDCTDVQRKNSSHSPQRPTKPTKSFFSWPRW